MILQEAADSAQNLPVPPMFKKSFMLMEEFSDKHSGAKSNNLKSLKAKLDWSEQSCSALDGPVILPESGSIPFQMAEYTIGLDPQINAKYQMILQKLISNKSVKKMEKMLIQCKDLVMGLKFNHNDKHHLYLMESLINFGIPADQCEEAWTAIKKVWASKFNDRAFLATQKLGVKVDQIFMAVLVQRVIPADYAYVIHTVNPTTQNDKEVYAEACIGLGEALVSDMQGQALSFTYDK
jgi:alpha-glucan,water dikinase